MNIRFVRAAVGCAMMACVATSISAAPTTYAFQGRLGSAGLFSGSSNPDWAFRAGDAFSGTLVYDPAAVANSYDYLDTPDFRLTFHRSPVVSLTYRIETSEGAFAYAPPAEGGYAAVGAATSPAWWSGVDLRFQNYPTAGGDPQYPVPATGYVGPFYAHATFVSLLDYQSRALTRTDADVDLAALFAALPPSAASFSVRFSDPARWSETPGVERIDGIVDGRIESLFAIGSAVPEPSSWALMILGFAVTGGALRRRSPTRARTGLA